MRQVVLLTTEIYLQMDQTRENIYREDLICKYIGEME